MPTGIYYRGTPPLCSVKDCLRPYLATGLCSLHWQRRKAGVPFDAPLNARLSLRKPPKPKKIRRPGRGWINRGYRYFLVDGERVSEQRIVMSKVLGRPLLPSEIVHHRDEDKLNNDPSNLQIVTRSEHRAIHNG